MLSRITLLLFFFLSSCCSWAPKSTSYRSFYCHLQESHASYVPSGDYYLVILVSAPHLDYSSGSNLIRTVAKHPRDGSLHGDVGHAWIYLYGKGYVIHGGQSGEFGVFEPKYFDGVMDYLERGEPNPICYMQKTLSDGCFIEGGSGHTPSSAAYIPLTEEQYQKMVEVVLSYRFQDYSLTSHQCVTLVGEVAKQAGIHLESQVTIPIEKTIVIGKERLVLWRDSCYATLTFISPDCLEKSLLQEMKEGRVFNVLAWYQSEFPICGRSSIPTCEQLYRMWHFCH